MFAPSDLFSVRGRTALVTGGATGLGRVCAEALLERRRAGAYRLAQGRGLRGRGARTRGNRPLRRLRRHGRERAAGVAALAAETRSRAGALHILVNNAGMTWGKPFETFPWKALDRVLSVNVTGLFTLTRELVPMLFASAAGAAVQHRQFRLGDGDRHPVGKRLFLFRLQGGRASSDPHSRRRIRRPACDGQRDRAGTVSDQHDEVRARRRERRSRAARAACRCAGSGVRRTSPARSCS